MNFQQHDWRVDDVWQRQMRDRILAPGFYGKYATDGRYVFIDKGRIASHLQRDLAVDTIVQGKNGVAVCIEEKIVRWPKRDKAYDAFTLETKSCTVAGREKDGWMVYSKADYLFYCFANKNEDELDCYLIEFPTLQQWFWDSIGYQWLPTISEQINHTECRIVPIHEVRQNVKTWRYQIYRPGLNHLSSSSDSPPVGLRPPILCASRVLSNK